MYGTRGGTCCERSDQEEWATLKLDFAATLPIKDNSLVMTPDIILQMQGGSPMGKDSFRYPLFQLHTHGDNLRIRERYISTLQHIPLYLYFTTYLHQISPYARMSDNAETRGHSTPYPCLCLNLGKKCPQVWKKHYLI